MPDMEVRRLTIGVGDRVWVETPTGQPAAPGWENGHEGHAIRIDDQVLIPMITVRDAAGRQVTVPHYEVTAGEEYRGRSGWVRESDPRVLDWLEGELRKGFRESDCGSVNRDCESRRERIRRTLRRHGRTPAA